MVLSEEEFSEGKNLVDRPLPFIEVPDAAVFPDANELWAWAHVHMNESVSEQIDATSELETALGKFRSKLAANPDLAYSRIMCPRKLAPNTAYHAFLVPVFESGRLAGLGHAPEETFDGHAELHATFSAWGTYSGRLDPTFYPVYYRWYFRTGSEGDFEYLVRLLKPQPADSRVGRRDMDVQRPGTNLTGILDGEHPDSPELGGILRLGGALKVPESVLTNEEELEALRFENWDSPYPRRFQTELSAFINLADDYQRDEPATAHQQADLPQEVQDEAAGPGADPDPLITAPLYGRWHALTRRLLKDEDGQEVNHDDNWVHELNLDPRFRAAAGFGTKVVQQNQEQYMEAAWKQVGKVLEANRKLRLSQLAYLVSGIWYRKQLVPLQEAQPAKFLMLTQPVQKRVLSNGMTIFHQVNQSLVPAVALSPALRKVARPGSRLVRKLPFSASQPIDALLPRLNAREVLPTPPKEAPAMVPTLDAVADQGKPDKLPGFLMKWLRKRPWLKWLPLIIAALIILTVLIIFGFDLSQLEAGSGSISGVALLIAIFLIWLFFRMRPVEQQLEAAENLREENQTPEQVDTFPKSPDFALSLPGLELDVKRGGQDSEESKRYKAALKDAFTVIQASNAASVVAARPPLDLPRLASDTVTALNPGLTIPRRVLGRVALPTHIIDLIGGFEIFKEAMAYPEFDLPMYKPLIDLSTELFVPNLNLIPQNSITLLETNQRFIEAYMVGLNHEFARELLWREYPTDQRGSYFRQFWDVSSFFDRSTDDEEELREKLRDIPPLHRWSRGSQLGDHDHREAQGDKEDELVLVIRGELLKKYPNAVIYAHKAAWQMKDDGTGIDPLQERVLVELTEAKQENPPPEKLKTPLYEAKVDPDIYFFGFDLTEEEAQGGTGLQPGDEDKPGWFFVIKERPGEPRFGLDIGDAPSASELVVWNDLTWESVLPGAPDGAYLQVQGSFQVAATIPDDQVEKEDQHPEDQQVNWHPGMSAAELAYILYQAPVMVAVHAKEMLPN